MVDIAYLYNFSTILLIRDSFVGIINDLFRNYILKRILDKQITRINIKKYKRN